MLQCNNRYFSLFVRLISVNSGRIKDIYDIIDYQTI